VASKVRGAKIAPADAAQPAKPTTRVSPLEVADFTDRAEVRLQHLLLTLEQATRELDRLRGLCAAQKCTVSRASRDARGLLTPQEARVVRLAAGSGRSTRDIALALGIGQETAKSHLRHAFRKLGVCSRVELVHVVIQTPQLGEFPGSQPDIPRIGVTAERAHN
jgi:DNA-binding CsgD family transcriptional regulator